MKYLKKFSTDSERVVYEGSENYLEPYVSYVEGDNSVHYNKPKETRVVAVFNVTSTSTPTKIGYNQYTSAFTEIEIDGAVQSTVVSAYTFDTLGEHTIKYTLLDDANIGQHAFRGCSSITSVTIPNSVTSIGNHAFRSCGGLTSLPIGNDVTSIGDSAFSECGGITSVTIGSGVTNIGNDAFNGCINLTSIVVDSSNTIYDSRDNCNAIIETSTNRLIAGCNNTVIPNSVVSFNNGVFYNCTGLTNVVIPDSVTSIGQSVFASCISLTSVTIGSGVTSIGDSAFASCSGLTKVLIPHTVTSVGNGAFIACSSLYDVHVDRSTPPTLGSGTFNYNASGRKIYVPVGSGNDYKTANNWSTYANDIEEINSSNDF